jgi:hypothetical protein
MNFLFGRSVLKKTIERGLSNGKLREELGELGELTLKSRADAEAVCWGLQQLDKGTATQLGQQTYALAGLFQNVKDGDCEAFEVLQEQEHPSC